MTEPERLVTYQYGLAKGCNAERLQADAPAFCWLLKQPGHEIFERLENDKPGAMYLDCDCHVPWDPPEDRDWAVERCAARQEMQTESCPSYRSSIAQA